MKERLVLAGIATVTMLGMGSISASAAPLGATANLAQPQHELLLKAHYDGHAPWWKRRNHTHRYDGYGYRDRPWWWRNKFDRGHDRRADRRDHRDDRSDRRRNRDW